MSWQVQEAKQRFSEVLRAVEKDGPQTITRHGEEVAVVVDIAEYRRLTGKHRTLADVLLAIDPCLDEEAAAVFDEIEAERKKDFGREIDFGFDGMSYLLDTNVISEVAKRRKNAGVLDWLAATRSTGHHISVLSVGELMRGIELVRGRRDNGQVDSLERGLATVRAEFSGSIVPITLDVAERWARLSPARPVPLVDALIGATAAVHGWTLVTRNTRDFEHIGVPLLNPFTL